MKASLWSRLADFAATEKSEWSTQQLFKVDLILESSFFTDHRQNEINLLLLMLLLFSFSYAYSKALPRSDIFPHLIKEPRRSYAYQTCLESTYKNCGNQTFTDRSKLISYIENINKDKMENIEILKIKKIIARKSKLKWPSCFKFHRNEYL